MIFLQGFIILASFTVSSLHIPHVCDPRCEIKLNDAKKEAVKKLSVQLTQNGI